MIEITNNLLINKYNLNSLINLKDIKKDYLIKVMLQPNHIDDLELLTYQNEKQNEHSFKSFSDCELIYYYLHMKTHDDEEKNRTRNTKKEYLRDLLQFYFFVSFLIEQENELDQEQHSLSYLKSLHKRHIRQYQDWLQKIKREDGKVGYAASTRARKNTVVKGLLNWLYNEDIMEQPLSVAFKKSTTRKREKPNRSLSLKEVQELLEFYREHPINHAILITLATTGLRCDEIASAKWSDVYVDSSIKEGTYYLKVIGKGKVERHARLLEPTIESIKRMRKRRGLKTEIDRNDDSPLLTTSNHKAYSLKYLSNQIITIIKKTNFEWLYQKEGNISPHWFRHFYINYSVIELGLPIEVVQQTVGHSSKETTQTYLDHYIQKKNDASWSWDVRFFA